MSWDISVMAARTPPPPVADMPNDWMVETLGPLPEVRAKISACLPATSWSDPNWGVFDGEGYSYEFNIGGREPCLGFMVHVRGGGQAVGPLIELATRYGWYMLDCSQGEWLHHCANPEAGWKGFQAYRDHCLQGKPSKSSQ